MYLNKLSKKKITFVLIAERDSNFFIPVAINFKKMGFNVNFLLFYEPALKKITKSGFEAVVLSNFLKKDQPDIKRIHKLEKKYNFKISDFIRHEKLSFGYKCDSYLIKKSFAYFDALERWVSECKPDFIVQELGGFIAPLSLYYVAIQNRITHIFIEPMFFRGTVCFLRNSLNFSFKPGQITKTNINKTISYLEAFKEKPHVLIPQKDAHHFNLSVFTKVINLNNLRKLLHKFYFKYLTKKNQEYDAIFNYTLRSLRAILNSYFLKFFYHKPDLVNNNIEYTYFPLHVPIDFALTVRSPKYINQISTIIKISKLLPSGQELWIKEHPASIGYYGPLQIFNLLKLTNIRIISPTYSSFDLIENATSVITINSKVGAEAIILRKNVFCLGEVFYRNSNLCKRIKEIDDLKFHFMKKNKKKFLLGSNYQKKQVTFFSKVLQSCYPGEMYVNDKKNIEIFSKSLRRSLS